MGDASGFVGGGGTSMSLFRDSLSSSSSPSSFFPSSSSLSTSSSSASRLSFVSEGDFPLQQVYLDDDDPMAALLNNHKTPKEQNEKEKEKEQEEEARYESGALSTERGSTEMQDLRPTPLSHESIIGVRNEGQADEANVIDLNDLVGMGPTAGGPASEADVTLSFDPNTFPGGRRFYLCWKWTNWLYMMYLLGLSVILGGGLIANGSATCEKPLRTWAAVELGIFIFQLLKNLLFYFWMPSILDRNPNLWRKTALAVTYLSNRVVSFIWFVWFIFGAVWTMEHSSNCPVEAPSIWLSTVSVVGIQLGLFALMVVLIWVGCCCVCVIYICYPNIFVPTRGATKSMINKTTTTQTFSEQSGIAKEDAICAICLSEYNVGDSLRYLPCQHHFHAECVDQWLLTNKSCASCRRAIDDPDGKRKDLEEGN